MKLSKRQLAIFASLILIVCLVSSGITYAVLSFSTVIESGSMVETVSYVVWVDGSTYYAKNGLTGAIDYSGTNLTQVIVSAWNNMPNGGCILLRGSLELSSPLIFVLTNRQKMLKLIGEGERGTFIRWRQSGTAITLTSGDPIVTIGWDMFILQDFTIDCGTGSEPLEGHNYVGDWQAGRTAIKLYQVGKQGFVKNVWIRHAEIGLHIYDTNTIWVDAVQVEHCEIGIKTEKGDTSYVNGIFIENVKATFCDKGIELGDGVSQGISTSVFEVCNYGIYSSGEGQAWRITDCHFEANTYYDIDLEGKALGSPIVIVHITDCWFWGNDTSSYAIKLNYTAHVVIENAFSTNHTSGFINPRADHPGVFVNNLYIEGEPAMMNPCRLAGPEGSRLSASNGDTINFTYAFAGTPQTLIITVSENDASYIAQPYSITATGFSLYLYDQTNGALETVDKAISWYAVYEPAP